MRVPLMETQQDCSIGIQDLAEVVMTGWRCGLSEQRLIPPHTARHIPHTDNRHVRFMNQDSHDGGASGNGPYASRIGSTRTGFFVAANMALATAGAMPGVDASPMPPGAFSLGTVKTSTTGASGIRITR